MRVDDDLPEQLWPSQDGVDRSGHFAIIAHLIERPGIDDDPGWTLAFRELAHLHLPFRERFEEVVREAINEVLPDAEVARIEAETYPIGPQAQNLPSDIITVWEYIGYLLPVLSVVADTWAVTEIVRLVQQKLQAWFRSSESSRLTFSLSYTAYALELMCIEFVRRTYHPRAKLTSTWSPITTEFYAGYISPAHPSGGMEYLVTVTAGRKSYSFAVKGDATVTAHHVKEGRRVTPLPLPDLLS